MVVGIVIYAAVLVMWGIPIALGFTFWQVAVAYGVIIAAGTLTCLIDSI